MTEQQKSPQEPRPAGEDRGLTRRQLVVAGLGAAGALAAGGYGLTRAFAGAGGGPTADFVLRAAPDTVGLGARKVRTWSFNGGIPGPELRVRQGERVRIRVENQLPHETTIHWHGIRLDNRMDGVPGLTQRPIAPGTSFVYEFVPPDEGTFMYHPHVGTQLDRALYGALIVEARNESLDYDREATLLLDDWLDGITGTPDSTLARLRRNGMSMGGMSMGGMSMGGSSMGMGGMSMGGSMGMGAAGTQVMARHTGLDGRPPAPGSLPALANLLESGRADAGDVRYPLYLVNGRPPEDPYPLRTRRGERVRLRLVNISSDTFYCVFVEQHPLTIVASDGQRVAPVETDAVLLGMGERYDVLLEARVPGAYRLIAVPLGKRGRAVATLRCMDAPSSAMPAAEAPFRMLRRIASYEDLRDLNPAAALSGARELRLDLGMRRTGYVWTIGGQAFPQADALRVGRNEQVRLVLRNRTPMPHPMHLHGHYFRAVRATGDAPRKDTITVGPMQTMAVELTADNPGRWAFHCHNAYHAEAGMMRSFDVAT